MHSQVWWCKPFEAASVYIQSCRTGIHSEILSLKSIHVQNKKSTFSRQEKAKTFPTVHCCRAVLVQGHVYPDIPHSHLLPLSTSADFSQGHCCIPLDKGLVLLLVRE